MTARNKRKPIWGNVVLLLGILFVLLCFALALIPSKQVLRNEDFGTYETKGAYCVVHQNPFWMQCFQKFPVA